MLHQRRSRRPYSRRSNMKCRVSPQARRGGSRIRRSCKRSPRAYGVAVTTVRIIRAEVDANRLVNSRVGASVGWFSRPTGWVALTAVCAKHADFVVGTGGTDHTFRNKAARAVRDRREHTPLAGSQPPRKLHASPFVQVMGSFTHEPSFGLHAALAARTSHGARGFGRLAPVDAYGRTTSTRE